MKYRLILISFILTNLVCYSQGLPTIIPPSPNAASLAQYADIPVSNYTGIPNITIPLFNIKSGKIELPITASYYASGIKVAQEASSIGLGWALNAGGVITRQIRGSDDFKNGGFSRNTVPPSTTDYLSHTPGAPSCPASVPPPNWGEYYHWINYPVTTFTNIIISYDFEQGTASVYDLLGRQMQHFEIHSRTVPIDLSNYTEGIYVVSIKTNVHMDGVKLIKRSNK